MKKRHLFIFSIFIIILITIFVIFYLSGYIPVFGKKLATNKLRNYLITEKKIEDIEYINNIKAEFNLVTSAYQFSIDNDTIDYRYYLLSNEIYDGEISSKYQKIANEDYKNIIKNIPDNLKFPESIFVTTLINADNYSVKSQGLYLISVYNIDKLSEEESLKMPANIAKQFIELMGEEYNFTSIQLRYNDVNGMYELALPFSSSEKLNYQKLLDKTKKDTRPSLDYTEWLEKQRKNE